jgi:hypothetical protein
MRETWRIRAVIVGFGLGILAASYLILIPKVVPPGERGWVYAAVPISFTVGLIVGIAALLMERRNPRLFSRYTPDSLRLSMYGLLGVLMAISEKALVVIGAAMAGATLLAATPFMRFPSPGRSDR